MLFIELSSHKTVLLLSILGYIADTAYLCWCHWSGAVETVLNDSRNQRVTRNSVTVYRKEQQTGGGQGHQGMLLPCAKLPRWRNTARWKDKGESGKFCTCGWRQMDLLMDGWALRRVFNKLIFHSGFLWIEVAVDSMGEEHQTGSQRLSGWSLVRVKGESGEHQCLHHCQSTVKHLL